MTKQKWGFLRETAESAKKAGVDADTGLKRTGLEDYLAVIFPNTNDWIHDKPIDNLPEGIKSRKRPDYRSKSLMLIVEFDGLQHYTKPDNIEKDKQIMEYQKTIEEIQRFQQDRKAAFLKGSNLDDTLYK